jgi:hypothetical protein
MEVTFINDAVDENGKRKDSRRYIEEYSVPSQKTINDRMKSYINAMPKGAHAKLDEEWNLASSEYHFLPAEASGALMAMWSYAILNVGTKGFSIRQAKWVNKLRWVVEAGGSPHGEILDAAKMYRVSSGYTARERFSEDTKQPHRGTAPLDAQVMLGNPNVIRLAILAGHKELKIDNKEIWSDISQYNPSLEKQIRADDQVKRGMRPGLAKHDEQVNEMRRLFNKLEEDLREAGHDIEVGRLWEEANRMYFFGMQIAQQDSRYYEGKNALNNGVMYPIDSKEQHAADERIGEFGSRMLLDVLNSYGKATWDTWVPNLDELFNALPEVSPDDLAVEAPSDDLQSWEAALREKVKNAGEQKQ